SRPMEEHLQKLHVVHMELVSPCEEARKHAELESNNKVERNGGSGGEAENGDNNRCLKREEGSNKAYS
ncbi:hypothetical protein MKX01_015116, partial [Papaver californicum]